MKRFLASMGSLLLMAGAFAPQAAAEAGAVFTGSQNVEIDGVATTLDYSFTANSDGKLTIDWNYIPKSNIVGLVVHEIYFPNLTTGNPFKYGTKVDDGEFHYTFTTEETYIDGDVINITFRPMYHDGGVAQFPVEYTYGSTNAPVETGISLTAHVAEITANSANIYWEVTNSPDLADAAVEVKIDDVVATESPMAMTNLDGNKEYTYTVTATAILGDKEYTAEPVTLTFKTLDPDAKDLVYTGTQNGVAKDVQIAEGQKEDVSYKLDYTITYTAEQKVVISAKYEFEKDFAGLVPQIFVDGPREGDMKAEGDNTYSYTLQNTYPKGQDLKIGFFIAYPVNSNMIEVTYKTGSENVLTGVATIANNSEYFNVYSINGVCVLKNATRADLRNLAPGLYIANGKKIRL